MDTFPYARLAWELVSPYYAVTTGELLEEAVSERVEFVTDGNSAWEIANGVATCMVCS